MLISPGPLSLKVMLISDKDIVKKYWRGLLWTPPKWRGAVDFNCHAWIRGGRGIKKNATSYGWEGAEVVLTGVNTGENTQTGWQPQQFH